MYVYGSITVQYKQKPMREFKVAPSFGGSYQMLLLLYGVRIHHDSFVRPFYFVQFTIHFKHHETERAITNHPFSMEIIPIVCMN